MFFAFPEDARWNAELPAVEFGVEIGEYRGVVRVPRRVLQRLLPERPTPERCVEAYHLQRTRFERMVERKLRQRQLTEDGNVEISGRDLREGTSSQRRLSGTAFLRRLTFILVAIVAAGRVVSAQSLDCPAPPQLPVQSQEDEKIKGELQGKAQFLTRMLANGNFQGAVEAERKTIYQSANGLQAPWQAAYLTYLFCSTVMSDKTLSSREKLSAILTFKRGMCMVPQTLLIKLAELVREGSGIQSDFIQTNDPTVIQDRYREWEPKVEKFVNDILGVTFLVEFTTAHGNGTMPLNHNAVGGGIWAEIQAKNAALTSIIQELRRC